MSRENVLTTGAMMDALMVANHINHHTDAEKKTAYMHSHINQTKPNDAENSGAVVRVGKKMLTSIFFAAFVFCIYNFTAFSQVTLSFETITEALNYAGDRAAVKKLVITGTISGDDYSGNGEWYKFRRLDETFPNIEEVEILTSQDIPDITEYIGGTSASLFYHSNIFYSNLWLKSFSAPNVTTIGSYAFQECKNLTSIDIPLATEIGDEAFRSCESLLSADFPLATEIGGYAFRGCTSLTSVNFPLVTTIGSYAFTDCTGLTSLSSVNFPLVTEIGGAAFWDCTGLTSVNFPLVTE